MLEWITDSLISLMTHSCEYFIEHMKDSPMAYLFPSFHPLWFFLQHVYVFSYVGRSQIQRKEECFFENQFTINKHFFIEKKTFGKLTFDSNRRKIALTQLHLDKRRLESVEK